MRKLLLLTLLFLLNYLPVGAQGFSYVYIQGDGETPIYVKLEGEMQPRLGTNYSILSRLAPGNINIEILFQQNKFPAQKFALKVPEGGARSLILVKKDNIFLLYDLRQNFYIPEGNVAADDKYVAGNFIAYNETPAAPEQQEYRDPPAREIDRTYREPKAPVKTSTKTSVKVGKMTEKAAPASANTGEPTFIPDLELNRNGGKRIPKTPAGKETTTTEKATPPAAQNTGEACSALMTIAQFGDFYGRFLQQPSLDAKLTYLLDADECPTPDQARIICRSLDTEAARLRYLGRVIRRSAKKKPFAALTNVFEDAENQKALIELTKS